METAFWFIAIGLTIYGMHHIRDRYSIPYIWIVDLLAGAGIGALIGGFRPVTVGFFVLPPRFTSLSGGLSGIMLWSADRLRLFEKQTVQYSLMIMMSLIHASVLYFIYRWEIASQIPEGLPSSGNFSLYIHLLLISAVSFVGFTFPKRLLKT
jgi:hypothetical protein